MSVNGPTSGPKSELVVLGCVPQFSPLSPSPSPNPNNKVDRLCRRRGDGEGRIVLNPQRQISRKAFSPLHKMLYVIGGDFNELLSVKEKGGGSDKSSSDMLAFRHAVEYCDLIDLGFFGTKIFSGGIDFFRPKLSTWVSIPLTTDRSSWGLIMLFTVIGADRKVLNSSHSGYRRMTLRALLRVFGVRKRSRVDWLSVGDHNSKYFNAKATARKMKNSISKPFDDNVHLQDSEARLAQIFDNMVASFETLYSIARKKSGKRGLIALKLDMSKAYDMVEWGFLRVVMERMLFPHNWIKLVMDCISTSRLSFVLNGDNICSVVLSRGLR
ncbi:hypothetical protein Dsin_000923 [Dipteronia sinensis]|uniref:Reverse transcriptase n=1 Tax=Dipteronia sinensis TaxID=43782 RepID=A0AAE0EIH8_9ROSI|nr:hypothetical protein Dsin_000923 [Dipteronia sinensis]